MNSDAITRLTLPMNIFLDFLEFLPIRYHIFM